MHCTLVRLSLVALLLMAMRFEAAIFRCGNVYQDRACGPDQVQIDGGARLAQAAAAQRRAQEAAAAARKAAEQAAARRSANANASP